MELQHRSPSLTHDGVFSNKALLAVWALILLWVLITLALAGWWIIFSNGQMERLVAAGIDPQSELIRYQKMLLWEGAFLVLLVLTGALVMAWAMWRQALESQRLKTFFATFSHELKTPLSSVMLKAEILAEQFENPKGTSNANNCGESQRNIAAAEFIADLSKLNLQLENAIEFAKTGGSGLFYEEIALHDLVTPLVPMFPSLTIEIAPESEAILYSDKRAMEIILRNLIANSEKHGNASLVVLSLKRISPKLWIFSIVDNGRGLPAGVTLFGNKKNSTRLHSGSGSGIGLAIANRLATSLGGKLVLSPAKPDGTGVKAELTVKS